MFIQLLNFYIHIIWGISLWSLLIPPATKGALLNLQYYYRYYNHLQRI